MLLLKLSIYSSALFTTYAILWHSSGVLLHYNELHKYIAYINFGLYFWWQMLISILVYRKVLNRLVNTFLFIFFIGSSVLSILFHCKKPSSCLTIAVEICYVRNNMLYVIGMYIIGLFRSVNIHCAVWIH